jgi:hypothetical protein
MDMMKSRISGSDMWVRERCGECERRYQELPWSCGEPPRKLDLMSGSKTTMPRKQYNIRIYPHCITSARRFISFRCL